MCFGEMQLHNSKPLTYSLIDALNDIRIKRIGWCIVSLHRFMDKLLMISSAQKSNVSTKH